jgi:hypothetical protein
MNGLAEPVDKNFIFKFQQDRINPQFLRRGEDPLEISGRIHGPFKVKVQTVHLKNPFLPFLGLSIELNPNCSIKNYSLKKLQKLL